jgi:hypothetical protein
MPAPSEFSYLERKDGSVVISHRGKTVTTLRGDDSAEFLTEVAGLDEDGQQHLMARVTGNYKRGNERTAKNHPRNRS